MSIGRSRGWRLVDADGQQIVLGQGRAGHLAVAELGEDAAIGGVGDEDHVAIGLDALQIGDLAVAQRGEGMHRKSLSLAWSSMVSSCLRRKAYLPDDGAPRRLT